MFEWCNQNTEVYIDIELKEEEVNGNPLQYDRICSSQQISILPHRNLYI